MPEAVIVSYARSPIGRANKGSLVGIRSDDLTAQMVKAALAKVPELDPTQVDDLMRRGIREFHFYTMNQSPLVGAVLGDIGTGS